MVSKLEILPADLHDPTHCQAIVSLLDHYAQGPMGGGEPLAAQVKQTVVAGLQAQPGCVVLLAYDGGKPIGMVVAFSSFSTFQAQPLLNVHDLAVHEDARGQGVGTALLEAIEVEARRRGCCKVTLEVRSDNEVALGLYRKLGFCSSYLGAEQMYFWSKPLS
ncbi:MAG TPA: GNAT family N-acetyltransferase [Planctomycetaceae bacterium]|nr:GNAT family N-acetyltransferase [Blastopirellula sp.]HAY82780.1 GNAT family N-acetyltransferase [Planctomycetaceae bacterium]